MILKKYPQFEKWGGVSAAWVSGLRGMVAAEIPWMGDLPKVLIFLVGIRVSPRQEKPPGPTRAKSAVPLAPGSLTFVPPNHVVPPTHQDAAQRTAKPAYVVSVKVAGPDGWHSTRNSPQPVASVPCGFLLGVNKFSPSRFLEGVPLEQNESSLFLRRSRHRARGPRHHFFSLNPFFPGAQLFAGN